jgi:myosin-crossreactive antigen
MIRDGNFAGSNISVFEALPVMGGSLDGSGDAERGYSMRGGRMLTTDNYECTWDLFKSIPSLHQKCKSVFDETLEFNEQHKAHSMARLVDRRRAKVPVSSMGFSMPYITSMFMPRVPGDRPLPVPIEARNFAFISQFVEIPVDVVFTVEYSVRAAQIAVYNLLRIDRAIPPVTPHDKSLKTQFEAILKAFK